ncbi:hypothetical protein V6N12_049088 [Hibiscus sabdariffa]|uniref:DUF4283 domain-containing protein n=1 Tax=Hibiscus sabdariffa TaxID=183260 RepID=A0ABR2EJ76_9ROSI
MAARGGQRSFWRKKRGETSSFQSTQKHPVQNQIHTSNVRRAEPFLHSVGSDDKVNFQRVRGVIEEEKMEILCFCALGVCCKPYLLLDLAREFRSACLEGFTVMRVAGSVVLLMFADAEKRRSIIENGCLDRWLENLMDWSPEFRLPNRRINESIELQLHDQIFQIRVVEFEEYINTKSECCCGADEDSSKSITERTAQESLHSAKAFSDGSNPAEVVVEDTVVPESVEDISSDQLRRMWDGNVRDDMRVREVVSSPRVWSNDEVVGCIARLETTIPSVVVVQEVVLSENRDA